MKLIVGLLAAVACLGGCPPPQPVNPPPDADGASPPAPMVDAAPATCGSMCANLKALGCPEGAFTDCAVLCGRELQDPGMPHPNVACIVGAASQDAVRGCGLKCSQTGR